MEFRKAKRQKAKLRLGIAGPSGSGKTYSALLVASGLAPWEMVAARSMTERTPAKGGVSVDIREAVTIQNIRRPASQDGPQGP